MKWKILTIILITFIVIGAFMLFASGADSPYQSDVQKENVTMQDGKQVVEIRAKGGYSPRVSNAKAGVPTTLRIKTNITFDCSSVIVIPSIGYQNNLPMNGTTDIEIPPQRVGTTLKGACGMGMYTFYVNFN